MSIVKRTSSVMMASGFHSMPPTSRPPTKVYDRQSYVLVVHESDEILKFLKMHLNRYFSHVVVARGSADGVTWLKQKEFDLVITEASPQKKTNADFLKKLSLHWRGIPVIITEGQRPLRYTPAHFVLNLVVGVVGEPLDMDELHMAIRRALNVRASVKELSSVLPAKHPIGELVWKEGKSEFAEPVPSLVQFLSKSLREEIVD